MRLSLVATREASRLTGLSPDQLREWTIRRALIPADIKPKNQGSPARFTWQTVLLLRIAGALRNRFHLELQHHRKLFASLGHELKRIPFASLWGKTLAIHGNSRWSLVDDTKAVRHGEAIVVSLNPHLRILSAGFSLPLPPISTGNSAPRGPHGHHMRKTAAQATTNPGPRPRSLRTGRDSRE